MISSLVLLGATGDLSQRYLFPALGTLRDAGRLPAGFRVAGGGSDDIDDEGFRRLVGDALPRDALSYRRVDLGDPASIAAILDTSSGPVAVYLALPPAVFATTITSLGQLRLPKGSRVVVEKPFGDDADSARALNALLARSGLDAYLVDHVLGMETTRNLVAVRHANAFLDRLWHGQAVEAVEILWEETIALEGRAGYFDQAGALKDVLQNHMLQLLALVAMEAAEGDDLHARKLDVLTALEASSGGRRARYSAGTLADGREVPAYADEAGVDPSRHTETFVEIPFRVDTPRWNGTRFVLRAGKALAARRKLVRLQFRGGGDLELGIDGPDTTTLRLRGAGGPQELRSEAVPAARRLPAYANVLLDILHGTDDLAVGAEEAEQAWRVVEPVLSAWAAGGVALEDYPAGSTGPGARRR